MAPHGFGTVPSVAYSRVGYGPGVPLVAPARKGRCMATHFKVSQSGSPYHPTRHYTVRHLTLDHALVALQRRHFTLVGDFVNYPSLLPQYGAKFTWQKGTVRMT